MLTTMAFDHSRRRWFGTCSCKPVPRGLPSSVEQLHTSRPLRPSLRSWRTVVGIAAKAQPASLQFPIQRIQVEIRQQRRQRPALRRALLASNRHPRRHHPGPQIPSDQPQHLLVPNHFRDPLHQNVMVDVVEELRDINIHHPVLARADVSLRRSYGVVRAAPRTKTVARLAEPRIENRLQHLQQRLLYHPIHHRRYAERTRPPVRLRDVHPPYGARRPSPGHEFRPHLRAVAPPMNFEFVDGHPIDPSRATVAFDRCPRPRQVRLGDHLVHQIFVHHFLSRVSRHAPWLPPAWARHGSTASAAACSPFRSPSPLFFLWGGGKDLAAQNSGKPLGRDVSRSSSFAPWSFGPSLQRRYPPSSLLWLLLTSPSLSRRSSPQVRCCFFPLVPSGSTSHVSDGHGASLCLASSPPVRGLSADSCSYGRKFVPRCLQLGSRRWPRDPPCGSLRLPPSVPVSTLQLTRNSPCWAHWRGPPACRAGIRAGLFFRRDCGSGWRDICCRKRTCPYS